MIEVKDYLTEDGKTKWGLYINDKLIGDSKQRFDADHAKRVLENELQLRKTN